MTTIEGRAAPYTFSNRRSVRRIQDGFVRILRRPYEIHAPDHYSVRTDVSFDDGATWIEDQVVLEVHR